MTVNDSHQVFVADPLGAGKGIIWQVGPSGKLTAVPGSQSMTSPDGFGFDSQDTMYVTDIFTGTIWTVPPGGTAQVWAGGLDLLFVGPPCPTTTGPDIIKITIPDKT